MILQLCFKSIFCKPFCNTHVSNPHTWPHLTLPLTRYLSYRGFPGSCPFCPLSSENWKTIIALAKGICIQSPATQDALWTSSTQENTMWQAQNQKVSEHKLLAMVESEKHMCLAFIYSFGFAVVVVTLEAQHRNAGQMLYHWTLCVCVCTCTHTHTHTKKHHS